MPFISHKGGDDLVYLVWGIMAALCMDALFRCFCGRGYGALDVSWSYRGVKWIDRIMIGIEGCKASQVCSLKNQCFARKRYYCETQPNLESGVLYRTRIDEAPSPKTAHAHAPQKKWRLLGPVILLGFSCLLAVSSREL